MGPDLERLCQQLDDEDDMSDQEKRDIYFSEKDRMEDEERYQDGF